MISSRTTTRTTGPLNGTRSACHGHTGNGRRYHIEDVAVDWLLDQIFRERKDMAALRGSDLRLEVITWKPLVVAADRSALLGSLCLVIQRMVLPGTELLLRVYPSHDDVCVTLEVERLGAGEDAAPMLKDCRELRFTVAANALRRMGGDLEVATGRRGGCLVRMWLPQWIPDPHVPL